MKIALCVAYLGSSYCGWQTQAQRVSVQQTIEEALCKLAAHPVTIYGAGRTDAGVHALKQVIHFETDAERSLYQWREGANFYLPADIRVFYASFVDEKFHARFSATSRVYRYVIYQQKTASVFLHGRAMFCPYELDEQRMQEAANCLLGEHDFSAFRGRDCQAHSPVKKIEHLLITRKKDFIFLDIQANAFLHHMVRNIVGSLLEIGRGKKNIAWFQSLLVSRDRRQAGPMAAACGLYLRDVHYSSPYYFPFASDDAIF